MIKVYQNYSLKHNHTFGVDIASKWFAEPSNLTELKESLEHSQSHGWKVYVIGEGSNLLITKEFEGIIIHPLIRGIEVLDESSSEVLVRAGAGENWDDFVAFCVEKNWYGTENLSLIPGSIGAVPVQNIGAYGTEAKEIIEYVEVLNRETGEVEVLSNTACAFGYRDSIFKHGNRNLYIVIAVVFRLGKKGEFMLDYGKVKEEFLKQSSQTLSTLRDTIISIRESKLPDPEKTGNAGSFFKNPVVSRNKFEELARAYDSIPNYPEGDLRVKIPAAWLIQQSGWKGARKGEVGTWPDQPLVIVNYGNAAGEEIFQFSEMIRNSVSDKFGISLEREVTVL